MKTNNTEIKVNLDTKSAIAYLSKAGFPDDLKDEKSIRTAFIKCSEEYLDNKIDTLLYCSIVNKISYIDMIHNQISLSDTHLDSVLYELSELQYYDLIHDSKKIDCCLGDLRQYLATKNREQ